ncbi:ABC transporter substrate-binding protein [Rhodobacter sphaeroides]|jgi:ABC-type nitrate/sulfonate/bicarbonate transport systems, periplasmic components|uniref:ABC transporter, periplasmic substrate-binding protein n=1 Tax=Cereibacter sphaeroides (strain ATCC 17023 / DSM 158 / JCM 6121 / CCUG 31486 / LMG 2827 / NBRC 12203 / NCIMB 8253 / ATH 2.4.1.) TaxID=272943 RepID=Q3J380_CERS4|nr:ABC transporter substrate-binding protein [Cereibacter sphaeroides]ABA78754.1 ABC transporter, periplasmic substrate-binding protein [Cereibacter sphaeroides 2.4.1]AMJ47090.1 ABC transporter substrate-binding protein [Cereibacter sphaeroides]ANS33804.1 ABC transporter substrate-binding protein [Cereibacter sphaeroides]ATN62847.1 ABC transporter substrate-binding protein [Cereibacter sphaeroides]AXC60966.1 ABC transporter substrate-binding protein [Cereibacter sphaeroides 2.4.1]
MKRLFALLLLAVAAPAAAEPFRLIVSDLETPLVPNSVMDLALANGYFERAGVEVELVRVQQTPMALAALQAGEGEMANVSTDALLQLAARGTTDLRAVMSPNKALPFLIAAKPEIETPRALEGRSFGIGRVGSLDHSLSAKVLAAEGVDVSKLNLVPLGQPAVRAQALLAGQVDATTMSIGTWTAMPDREGLRILVGMDAYFAAAPVTTKVNAVTTEVLKSRRAEVEAVIEALVLAARDFQDPATWVERMAVARPDVPRADLEELARAYRNSWSIDGGFTREELKVTTEWMYGTEDFQGLRPVGLEEWTDFGPLETVLQKLGPAQG